MSTQKSISISIRTAPVVYTRKRKRAELQSLARCSDQDLRDRALELWKDHTRSDSTHELAVQRRLRHPNILPASHTATTS